MSKFKSALKTAAPTIISLGAGVAVVFGGPPLFGVPPSFWEVFAISFGAGLLTLFILEVFAFQQHERRKIKAGDAEIEATLLQLRSTTPAATRDDAADARIRRAEKVYGPTLH